MEALRQYIRRDAFDAALFDLDGVLASTVDIHASCWKQMFDDYLCRRTAKRGEDLRPFELEADYKAHVDGRTRIEGVRNFLVSRKIEIPEGLPNDLPEAETAWGLANRKFQMVEKEIDTHGIRPFNDAVSLVHALRARGIQIAVVSSSSSCRKVLQAMGLSELFNLIVDAQFASQFRLDSKPAPATFLAAAATLRVPPARAVIVEDAIAGVQAGRAGCFGLVVGVARTGNASALQQHGADIVVNDLTKLIPPNGL